MARHRRPKPAAKAAPPAGQPRLGASALSAAVAPGIFPARQFVVYVAPASLGTHAFPAAAEPRARRRAAGALLRLLRALPGVARVQRGSGGGDAFLQPAGGGGHDGGFASESLALSAALALADGACAAAASQLGIALGAGVAPNKLLARLACSGSAPAGVAVVLDASAAAQVLAAAPAAALPGAAPLMAQLAAAGLTTASAVARTPSPSLAAVLSCSLAAAAALLAASRGVCPDGPVVATEASSNVHVVLELPAAVAAPADDDAVHAEEEEDASLAAAFSRLGAELAAAVVDDAAEWLRWPTTMAVTVDCDPPLPLCPSRKLAFPPPPRGWPPRDPPTGAPPELDAAAEAALAAAVADAAAASFRRARGAGPRPRVTRLMLLAAKFQDAAAAAAAQEVPLSGLKFSELPSPAKHARLEAAAAVGAKPINVLAMMYAMLDRSKSAAEVAAAIDAAKDRVAKELARRGGPPAW